MIHNRNRNDNVSLLGTHSAHKLPAQPESPSFQRRMEALQKRPVDHPGRARRKGKGILWVALLFLAVLFPGATSAEADVAALLRMADAHRRPEGSVRVETEIRHYREGRLEKERRYTVYLKPGRRSLVLMKSPAEIGQKLLMLQEKFWLLTPESQRPIRITANQKLLGEASTGDIASMTWSEEYTGRLVGEVDCPRAALDLPDAAPAAAGERCLHLDLAASAPGVTYARIDLFLEKKRQMPVKADLFVASGKQAKEAWFREGALTDKERVKHVTAMVLIDHIQTARHTVIHYRRMETAECPDEFFNPAALARNPLSGW
jgi:hypothetical protein